MKVRAFLLLLLALPLRAEPPECVLGERLEEPVTEQKITEFFEKDKVKSSADPIDALVCCLPTEMRLDPPYVHTSGGKQAASYEWPRFLLRSVQTRLILAISGTTPTLEMIAEKKGEGFESHLTFSQYAPGPKGLGHNENKNCADCHHGHHNWNTYRIWPGLYGADDDYRFTSEEERWQTFMKNSKTAPRYRCLVNHTYTTLRNFEFGRGVAEVNARRVATLIDRDPKLKPFRAAMLGVTLCPSDPDEKSSAVDSFLPDELLKRLDKKNNYAAQLAWVDKHQDQYVKVRLEALKAGHTPPGKISGTNRLQDVFTEISQGKQVSLEPHHATHAQLRLLTRELAGSNTMEHWTTVPDSEFVSFNTGAPNDNFFRTVMGLVESKWLTEMKDSALGARTLELCKNLRARSKSDLKAFAALAPVKAPGTDPVPLKTHVIKP